MIEVRSFSALFLVMIVDGDAGGMSVKDVESIRVIGVIIATVLV